MQLKTEETSGLLFPNHNLHVFMPAVLLAVYFYCILWSSVFYLNSVRTQKLQFAQAYLGLIRSGTPICIPWQCLLPSESKTLVGLHPQLHHQTGWIIQVLIFRLKPIGYDLIRYWNCFFIYAYVRKLTICTGQDKTNTVKPH